MFFLKEQKNLLPLFKLKSLSNENNQTNQEAHLFIHVHIFLIEVRYFTSPLKAFQNTKPSLVKLVMNKVRSELCMFSRTIPNLHK